MNRRQKEREANRQEKACRDGQTKTARQEATSLIAIFTRPHYWSKQQWTDRNNNKEKKYKKQDKRKKNKKTKDKKQ